MYIRGGFLEMGRRLVVGLTETTFFQA